MNMILTCVAGIDNCGKCLPFHPHHPHLSTHFLHHHQREDGEEDDDEENDDEDWRGWPGLETLPWSKGRRQQEQACGSLSLDPPLLSPGSRSSSSFVQILPVGRFAPLSVSSHPGRGKPSWRSDIRIDKLPKLRRCVSHFTKVHIGKIHFANLSLKAVGHSFQKINDIPWSTDIL